MTKSISPLLAALALFCAALVFSGAQCFPRQCESPANCERSCDCVDSSANRTITCPAFFQCDLESRTCEDDYNLSCDEICGRFAATGTCGSLACDSNPQCVRNAQCAILDAQGGLVCEWNCDNTFECSPDSQTCEAGFAQPDEVLCAQPQCNPCGTVPACAAACAQ